MKKYSSIYIILIFNLLFLIFFISCSTSPETGSLSGTILLDGQEDHSGITVAVYNLAELDPDIVAINEEYDFIGVIINQHTEFDHRFANLVKSITTNASGHFNINDISTGRYNVVAIKDSFGFRYVYNVLINENDNYLTNDPMTNDFYTLYPVTYISSDIDTATTWFSYHHYIIEPEFGDYITISGALTIEPSAIIRLNEGVKLTISGNLTAIGNEDNIIWFTSNDGLDSLISLYPYTPYTFHRIELIGSEAKQVAWCKFDHAGIGLLNKVNGFSISNCIFRNSGGGFESNNLDSTFCNNLLCDALTFQTSGGINFTSVNSGVIEKSILCNSYNGLRVKDQVEVQIKNNMFTKNTNGVYLVSFIGDFINNELSENDYDISVCGQTSPDISYNIINSNTGIFVLTDVEYQNATPIIQRNNIYCKNWFMILAIRNRFDIETNGNYFNGLTDIAEIKQKIMDKEDYPPDEQEDVGNVLINSVSPYEISGAGIHQ